MDDKKGTLKKDFSEKQQNEYPGNHPITGKYYQKAIEEKPANPKKLDNLKKVSVSYDKKSAKLEEIKKRARAKYEKPSPELKPKGTPAKKQPDLKKINNTEKRLLETTTRLKESARKDANTAMLTGKAKEDFNKSK